ncbi:hypothetical protein B296_00028791, partial [Ensete ventricosum]
SSSLEGDRWRRSRKLLRAIGVPERRSSRPSAPSATPSRRAPVTSKVDQNLFLDVIPVEFVHLRIIGSLLRTGPNLNGLFGRQSGTAPGYSYSTANKNMAVIWQESTLYDYLLNPKKVRLNL